MLSDFRLNYILIGIGRNNKIPTTALPSTNRSFIIISLLEKYSYWKSLADPGIYFGGPNQDPQSTVEGEARIEGAKRQSIEGAKRPRIEGEARTEGEAREKAGGGIWGGGSVSPSPENF